MLEQMQPLPSWSLEQTWGTFEQGTFHTEINGVELQKSAADLKRYEELVELSQPDIVIETGTRAGGSALWFHHELDLQVVTIDIAPSFGRRGAPPWDESLPGIESLRGSSISPDIVNHILPLIRGKRVMVSLDSDHHSAHVQAEMAFWSMRVSPGCYLVVEDGCFDMFSERGHQDWARVGGSRIPDYGGPLHALRTSGIEYSPVFWRDKALEGLSPISHSPCGWWRKHE